MFEIIQDMPDGTLGVMAKGNVSPDDCERTLLPLVANRAPSERKAQMLLLFGRDFQDFTTDALANATEFAFKHWREVDRLAVVSDVEWVRKAIWLFAPFMRGNVRVFHDYELEQAKTWIVSQSVG
jgi:hypothetical protein